MTVSSIVARAASLLIGIISLTVWTSLAIWEGWLWRDDSLLSEKIAEAQHNIWSLEPRDAADQNVKHNFLHRRDGLQLHCLSPSQQSQERKPCLIIFLHGFPDSCQIFTHFLSSALNQHANMVALDLPGFGGSDGLPAYGPDEMLNLLGNAIALLKVRYLSAGSSKCILVGHDWGGVIASRIGMETKGLVDRVVIVNAPVAKLFMHNLRSRIDRCGQLVKRWTGDVRNRRLLRKARDVIAPAFSQLLMSNYIFMFQLPISTHRAPFVVRYLLSKCHNFWTLDDQESAAWAWASSIGPSAKECIIPDCGLLYGSSVRERALKYSFGDWDERTRLYRESLLTGKWTLDEGLARYAPSHEEAVEDGFPCSVSIVFGKQDPALHHRICVESVDRYFSPKGSRGSEEEGHVMLIDDCGHWSPLEERGRQVIVGLLLGLLKLPKQEKES